MYNRYIHQNDGSFQRKPVPERQSSNPPVSPPQKEAPKIIPPKPKAPPSSGGAVSFLRQLLPKEFDTADLIIVLLLLLMAGDCEEERNTALLTLALYFFM